MFLTWGPPQTSLEKSPDSIQSKKTSAEDNQSSPFLSTLALRLKLESRNSPRNSLKTRPDSIKPLVLKYEDERSRGNSPVNRVNSPVFDKFYLTLDEEAISRPYCESHFMVLDSKEKSYGERMAYWRQKKIQQYRIAKNIQGSKNSLPSSPRKVLSGKEKNGPGKVKGSSYEKIALGKNGPGGFCRSGKDGGGGFAHNFGEWDNGLILNRIPGFFSYSNTPISLRKNLIIKDIK